MTRAEIEAKLRLKDELSAGMKKATGATKKFATETKKTSATLGDLRLKYLAAAAAVGAVIKVASDSLRAYSAQQDAVNKLNLALANQGNLLPGTSQRLQEYASALQMVTTFGDEVILQGQGLLATFGMNEEQIRKTTKVALDFSAATGRDLTMAINLLGKAFVGETGELSRYGIIIDKNIPKSEKFAAVIEQLTERFGGQAQVEAQTFTGQMTQMSNAFGDVQESIGKFLGEFVKIGGTTQGTLGVLQRINQFIGGDMVIALGEARALWSEWAATVLSAIAKVVEVWSRLPSLLADIFGKFADLPVVGKAFEAVAAGMETVGGTASDAAERMRELADGLREGAAAFREESNEAATAGVETKSFQNVVTEASTTAATFGMSLDKAKGSISNWTSVLPVATEATERLSEAEFNAAENMRFLDQAAQDMMDTVRSMIILHNETNPLIEKWGDVILNQTPKVNEAREHVDRVTKATYDWNDITGALSNTLGSVGNILSVFGVNIDGVLGKITRFISGIGGLINSLTGFGGMLSSLFGGGAAGGGGILGGILGGGGGGAGAGLGGLGGVFGQIGGAVSSGFSALGGLAAAAFSNPFSAAIVGLGAGLAALFGIGGKKGWEKAGEELSKSFGMEFSKGLMFHIEGLADGNFQLGIQRALSEVIKEATEKGGADLDQLAERINDTFAFLGRGELDVAEATQILQDSLGRLLPFFDQLGEQGKAALRAVFEQAKNMGLEFDNLQVLADLLGETLDDVGDSGSDAMDAVSDSLGTISNAAEDAIERIKRLGKASASVDIPDLGGGGGGPVSIGMPMESAQAGLFKKLKQDTLILAHAGELAAVIPKHLSRAMDVVSAQGGFIGNISPEEAESIMRSPGATRHEVSSLGQITTGGSAEELVSAIGREVQKAIRERPSVSITRPTQFNIPLPEVTADRGREIAKDLLIPEIRRALRFDDNGFRTELKELLED